MTDYPDPLSGSAQDETLDLRPKFNADGLIAAIAQDAGTGEVLVDIHRASVNGADWKVRAGNYSQITKFPLTPFPLVRFYH